MASCEQGIASCEQGIASCEQGIASCEQGIASCEQGIASCEPLPASTSPALTPGLATMPGRKRASVEAAGGVRCPPSRSIEVASRSIEVASRSIEVASRSIEVAWWPDGGVRRRYRVWSSALEGGGCGCMARIAHTCERVVGGSVPGQRSGSPALLCAPWSCVV